MWEYAALVTSVDGEILTLGQLYRDCGDAENGFDELKNQWGWAGFTTQDLSRCRLLAAMVALFYNWWSLFVPLAEPEHHREAVTTRPLLLSAIARQTRHAGQTTLTISSIHAHRHRARHAYARLVGFLNSCIKPRSSWIHCNDGIGSSARLYATSLKGDNWSPQCGSTQHELNVWVVNARRSTTGNSTNCRI